VGAYVGVCIWDQCYEENCINLQKMGLLLSDLDKNYYLI